MTSMSPRCDYPIDTGEGARRPTFSVRVEHLHGVKARPRCYTDDADAVVDCPDRAHDVCSVVVIVVCVLGIVAVVVAPPRRAATGRLHAVGAANNIQVRMIQVDASVKHRDVDVHAPIVDAVDRQRSCRYRGPLARG